MEWLTAVGLVSTVVLYDIMATVAFCAGRVGSLMWRVGGSGRVQKRLTGGQLCVCVTVYTSCPSVCLSVCLSVPSIESSSDVKLVCCSPGADSKYRSIAGGAGDRVCIHWQLAAAGATAACSVMLRAEIGSFTQTCLESYRTYDMIMLVLDPLVAKNYNVSPKRQ